MSESKRYVLICVLISLFTISLFTALSVIPAVFSQEDENIFSVSPGAFTARDAPPLGTPYIIPQSIVVWNRDKVARVVSITSEIPTGAVSPGYEPIPNENWVTPLFENNYSSVFTIPENSFAKVIVSFDIPRWENLTGENWDVRIHAERQPIIVDNILEPVVLGLDVIVRIQTTKELPPPPGKASLALLAMGIVIAIVIISIGAWIWVRKDRGKPKKEIFSRHQG